MKIKIIARVGEMEKVLEVETEQEYLSSKIRLLKACFDLIDGKPVLKSIDMEEV